MTTEKKTVLITGCSEGGIGSSMAKQFATEGNYHVFATARNPSKMAQLQNHKNISVVQLDPTSPESVKIARKEVEDKTGGKLDVLINNAGSTTCGPVLDADIEKAKEVYEINIWGAVRVTQEFSELIVKAKGTIVFNSSIASAARLPYLGMYGSSKAALNHITSTLRAELAPFGVKVVTLLTGAVDTKITEKASVSLLPDSLYRPVEEDIKKRVANPKIKGTDVDEYAKGVVEKIVGGAEGFVWQGKFSWVTWFMSTFIPRWIFDSVAVRGSGLEKLKL